MTFGMEKLKYPPSPEEERAKLERDAAVLYEELIQKPEISEALSILDDLPEHLHYHNKAHTLDVLKETILFAVADGASRDVIEEQAIAAAWHDTGFIEQDKANEPIAVELFEQSAAYKALSEETRKEIIEDILDTAVIIKEGQPFLLQQQSKFGYVLDGDVSNFGRKDFFEKRMKVIEELNLDLSDINVKKGFYKFSLNLLKNHEWKTASARSLRQTQKEDNLRQAEEEYTRIA
ncbi:MAG: hypothetical protein Q8O94_02575 [bacterium]|nr:hypothetical protein [bacterium]